MEWKPNRIVRVGKNSGPILCHLWTKVHEVLGQCRGLLVLYSVLAQLSVTFHSEGIHHQVSKLFKTEQNINSFWPPIFWEG